MEKEERLVYYTINFYFIYNNDMILLILYYYYIILVKIKLHFIIFLFLIKSRESDILGRKFYLEGIYDFLNMF